ncbi:MAG: TIM barrel protein [Proteobacteria bacterium]|nr:TIM barrel protein [Pseudomonadota bacterium]
MARDIKFSAGIWAFTGCADRFCTTGYRDPISLEDQIRMAGNVKGLGGLILQYPNVIHEENASEVKKLIEDNGLEIAAVDANIFGREFKNGGLSNANPTIRQKAVDVLKRTMDTAAAVGCRNAGLWPGQDGFDYPFQENLMEAWNRERDCIAEAARHNPDVRICIEYKVAEPRTHILVGSAGRALALCYEIGMDNIGVTFDVGHAFMAKESPAEAATYLALHGKLFSIHFNDAYGCFDDDMIAGSIHIWQVLEMLYYMDRVGYDGWYGLDIFPCREDIIAACELSIENIKDLREVALEIDSAKLEQTQAKGDAIDSHRYMRDFFFNRLKRS